MMDKLDPRSHPFNAALVHSDLEAHPEMWAEVVYEHEVIGRFGKAETAHRHTYFFILPARDWEASMMVLAARWYPEHLGWFDQHDSPSPATDQRILIATWNA